MEQLNFSSQEMKKVIDEGKLISDAGFSGAVFLYGNKLIKLHKELYHYLKINSITFADSTFNRIYMWNNTPFVDEEQIKYLKSKQKDIKRTEFDHGIVKVNNRICGVILENHLDYKDLTNIDIENPYQIVLILKNILLALRELEEHRISHLDLAKGEKNEEPTLNVLYKGTDIKLCDLSGKYITYGENFDSIKMYQEYADVFLILLKKLEDKYPNFKGIVSKEEIEKITNYEQALKEIENMNNNIARKL